MGNIRGTHSSPGVYDKITDLFYAANTMGITSLGLVGETLKGPAFQPIKVGKWGDYVNYFGGTSTKKFKGNQYPKFELPYIAKSYLKASDQLYVCRVLGLSGYNAGPAFVITATKSGGNPLVVAVLRSRGKYVKNTPAQNECNVKTDTEILDFDCDEITLTGYTGGNFVVDCSGATSADTTEQGFGINSLNLGRFTIIAKKNGSTVGTYPVSLNAGEKDYIYNVLGGSAAEGSAAVFVEEFYDAMLEDAVLNNGYTAINSAVTEYNEVKYNYLTENGKEIKVVGFTSDIAEEDLTKRNLGQRFLDYDEADTANSFNIVEVSANSAATGNRYVYSALTGYTLASSTDTGENVTLNVLYVSSIKTYVYRVGNDLKVANDLTDYREMFRYASTPWIVSELKGDTKNIELKKLFRFHTISDGNYANQEVKISIANIKPDEGLFDVYVRSFNDTDANPVVLESYRGLSMVPGSVNYIGLKIGTFDGAYEPKSNYVTVEIIENDMTAQCVPGGFLGYPVRSYGDNIKSPYMKYNTIWDSEVKDRRQYFGISDIAGIDVDVLTYKGKDAYDGNYTDDAGYTHAFHLDSTLSYSGISSITVDGVSGYTFDTVDPSNILDGVRRIPVLGTEAEMEGTIYENVALRKFTVCPCGGFDGWDIYRSSRTNTDAYKASKYKGKVGQMGAKTVFAKISENDGLPLSGNCITSDYYAYLAGINQFANPERYEINLFATPGIDYVNNKLLVEDALDVIESRKDTLYIPTTPDKPWGASDDAADMFTSKDAAENLEDTDINTYYAATYYPWVKYFDGTNNMYINLPPTKDVLRNMADVDDKRFPWIAPAGMERGKVECKKLHTPSTIEDRDNVYDGRINPLIDYSKDGVRVWGNKTMYICDETNPMNRINVVRLVLYMRKLINEASRGLIFDPNDETLADEFYSIVEPILKQIKKDRGITDFKLQVSQTKEQMDLHEMSCTIFIKPTPTLEYIEINYVVTPQGISFEDIKLAV